MATVGQQLTAPEAGWRRYEDTNKGFQYSGDWWTETHSTHSGGSCHYATTAGDTVSFRFYGTKLRIIGSINTMKSKNIQISIDGVVEIFSQYGSTYYSSILNYEKTGLQLGYHDVVITVPDSSIASVDFDAIDIDDIGYLCNQIGQQLTTPEPGWKRYDDTHPAIKYIGSGWNTESHSVHYNNITHWTRTVGNKIKFKFKGTKIRIITDRYTNRLANSQSITIDGVKEYINTYGTAQGQTLTYEKTGLEDTVHEVELQNETDVLTLDAIDIDDTGRLLHPDEVTDIADLDVGKRIRCHYQAPISGQVGVFSGLGQETSDFIPPASSATPNGDFYWICIDRDYLGRWKLIADRNIQHSISWDTINSEGMTNTGREINL